MAKIELKAQGKTREEAFGKLAKAMNTYLTHKFNVDDIRESRDGSLIILSIVGELDD